MAMMPNEIEAVFVSAKPKAVDFAKAEYDALNWFFDKVAAENGYRLAGFRLERAVFTTKAAGGSVTR